MKKVLLLVLFCVLLSVNPSLAKEGTLLVAFGTTMEEAKPALDSIEKAFKDAKFPNPVMAYTSDIVRKRLADKKINVLSVNAALTQLAKSGVKDLTIQSLHVLPAEEYAQLERMVIKFITNNPKAFNTVKAGYPLLVSKDDMDKVLDAMLASIPSKDIKKDDAILFMAHGNDRGPGDLAIYALNEAIKKRNPNAHIAAVEGAVIFDDVRDEIKKSKAKRVWLKPFMIVAGDHARNDLAGDEEDSWASEFKAIGIEPLPILQGMGEMKAIQNLFIEHAKNAVVDLANTGKKD